MKKIQLLRLIFLLLMAGIMMTDAALYAQCPVSALTGGGGTSGNARAPSTRYRLAQAHYIISPAEMAAAGFVNGQTFSQIGWGYTTAPGVAGTGNLRVWFQNTTDATDLKSTTWATALTGMTEVHNAATTLPGTVGNFLVNLSNGAAFTYTGQGIYVAFQWEYCVGTLSTTAVVDCNTAVSPGLYQAQSTLSCTPVVTLNATPTAFRPATRLTPSSFNNDAKVDLIYTYGSLPNVFTSGHQIQSRITNVGINPYTGNVTLNITGANTFSDIQTVTSLPSCSSTVVTFSGYTPTSTGANTISVSVPPDDNTGNDALSMSQPVTANLYSYKYTAPLTGGVGFNPGIFGVFVSKFNAAVPALVNEVKVDFQLSSASRQFRIAIFDEISGQPGNLLYVSPSVINISSAAQQAFIPITPAQSVSGNFFVGVVQETSNTVNIGFSYQSENPTRTQTFFFANAFTGPWTDFGTPTVFPFRSAIEVQFFIPSPPNCALLNEPADGGVACINGTTLTWASGGGGPTGYKVYFGTNFADVDGENPIALVQNSPATSYATGPLTNTTYYWKVVAYNVDGDATGCSTRSFTTDLISCYCIPTYANGTSFGDYISLVEIPGTTLNNPTLGAPTAPYYTLYPASGSTTCELSPGGTYNMNVAGGTWIDCFIRGWIDYNQNGTFEPTESIGVSGNVGGPTTGSITFTVDPSALLGPTRMRLRSSDTSPGPLATHSCGATNSGFGETEDYIIDIVCGVTASSNEPVCENETLLLDATYLGSSTPVTWVWSGPNGFSASVEDPSRPGMTLADAGIYTVTVTDAASCSATTTVNVGVSPLPAASASTNAPVCEGDALTVSSLPNGMLFYEWSGPNGFSAFTQNPTVTGSAASVHAGTYTVTVTSSFLCSATANVNVVVNPRPVPFIINQINVSCNGGNDGEVEIGSSGASPFFFDWGFNNDFGVTTTISNLTAQTLFVQVTDDNGCISNPDLQVDITEPAVLTAGPTSNSPLCTTGTLNLNSNAAGGTSPYSYVWSGPNGFNATDQNPSIVNPPVANSGTYTVTVTDDNGCVTSASTSVTIIAAPTAAATGGGNLCLTQSGTVTLNFTGTGPWSGTVSDGVNSVNFGPTNNNPENVAVTPTLTGVRTYTVTALSDANCPAGTSSGSAVFTVSSAPPAGTIGFVNSPASACSGTVTLVTTNAVSGQNIQYSWNTGSYSSVVQFSNNIGGPFTAGPFVTTTNQVYAQYGALGGSTSGYNICVQAINGCGVSNNKCNFSRGTVSTPVGITGSATQCSGATGQVYSVTGPLPVGVQTFVWSFSVAGAVITSLDPPLNSQVSIDFPAFSTGTLSVQAGLSCLGSSLSPARTLALSNATVAPAVPTGPIKVCPGNSYNYSVPAVAGATGYNWTVPANATITGGAGTNSITVQFNATPINFVNGIVSV
ncbi:MAG: hypothetical protein JNL47_09740, partial [Bacteroidia bacterium]|nr:hypothetical protein [Bacteroidia bacterium]